MFEFIPEIEWLFGSLLFYLFLYKITHNHYNHYYESYRLLDDDKQRYFQKNIVKSGALIILSLYGSFIFVDSFLKNKWNNKTIYRIGFMYSGLDVMGLLMVKNLPLNSKIHHLTTTIFSLLNTQINYNKDTFWFGIIVYCILSCYAWPVNYFLAIRLIKPLKSLLWFMQYNIVSYSLLLLFNWTYQVYNIRNRFELGFGFILFVVLVGFVAYDDIKLVKFLVHYYRKTRIEILTILQA